MPSDSFAQSRASAWTRWCSSAKARGHTRSLNLLNTTIVSVITRVWTTESFDRNSLSIRDTVRCGVVSDWADCSIITIARQPESGDHPRFGVRLECAPPILRDRSVERCSPTQASHSPRSASGQPSPRRGTVESDFARKLLSGNSEIDFFDSTGTFTGSPAPLSFQTFQRELLTNGGEGRNRRPSPVYVNQTRRLLLKNAYSGTLRHFKV